MSKTNDILAKYGVNKDAEAAGNTAASAKSTQTTAEDILKKYGVEEKSTSTADRAVDALVGAIKNTIGSVGSALSTSVQASQSNLMREEEMKYQRDQKTYEQMLAENAQTPGKWSQETLDSKKKDLDTTKRMLDVGKESVAQSGLVQGANRMREGSSALMASGAEDIARAKDGLGGVGQFVVDAGVAGTQLAGDMLVGAMTGGIGALPMMAVRSFGAGAEEARQAGANLDQQVAYGLGNAALGVVTEKIANVAKPFKNAFKAGVLDDAIAQMTGKLGQSAAGKMALSALSEGGEEFVEAILQPILQRAAYDPNASFELGDALYQAAIGGVLGGAGGAVDVASQSRAKTPQQPPSPAATQPTESAAGTDTTGQTPGAQGLKTPESANFVNAIVNSLDPASRQQTQAPTNEIYQPEQIMQIMAGQQKTAPKTEAGVNENGLAALTEQEQVNLSSGKRNKIISTFEDAVAFVRNAIENRQNVDRAYMGKVPNTVADKVLSETGVDITGFSVMMNGNNVRHILKSHGDVIMETARGQVAVTPEDIARVPEILAAPDHVTLSEKPDNNGRTAIVFEKQIGDNYVTIQGVSDGKRALLTDTLYKTKRRTRATRDTMPDTMKSAAPVINARSEPPQSSSVNYNISHPENPVNLGAIKNSNSATSEPYVPNGVDASTVRPGRSEPAPVAYNTVPQGEHSVNPGTVGAAAAGFDPYTAAQNDYGTLPSGENPVRSDDVPVSVDGTSRVSQSVVTAKGAQVTPDEFVPLLHKETIEGRYSFIPITNDASVQAAEQKIMYNGWEKAKTDWTADVRRGRAGDDVTAMGALLYNHAVNSGNLRDALDIFADYQMAVRSTARGLQAARILKTLTPDSRLYMMQRSIQSMVDSMGLDQEITIPDELLNAYRDAQTEAEADTVVGDIQQYVADQIPSTWLDKWTALRYVNMLGNFKTQVRNVVGNTGMGFVGKVRNTIAAGLEMLADGASGGKLGRTRSIFVGGDLLKAAKADFSNVKSHALGSGKYSDGDTSANDFAQGVQDRRQIFAFPLLEGYRKATNWAMNNEWFGDEAFSKGAYARALAGYLQANKVSAEQFQNPDWQKQNPDLLDRARRFAVKEAQEATFRDSNTLSDWVSKIGRRPDTPKWAKMASEGVMPFRKTPANVLVRAEEYSPLGLLNTAVQAAQAARGSGNVTGTDVINSLSKTLTGTGLFVLGMALRNNGFLRGADDEDEKQAAFDDLTGHQAYSLELPDGTSITLDWLTPAAMPLFMGVQLEDLRQDGGFELKDLEQALTSIAEPMLQMSMLQGISDTLSDLKYSESNNLGQTAATAALGYLTQGLTNSLVGQITRAVSGENTMTYVDKESPIPAWLQREIGSIVRKTPGLSEVPALNKNQIPYLDAWGREKESEDIMVRMVHNLFNPAYASKVEVDKVESELQRVYDATGANVFPSRAEKSFTVNGETKYLTADQYVKYAKDLGQSSYKMVQAGMATEAYRRMNDRQKAEYLEDLYGYAKATAKAKMVGDTWTDKWVKETVKAQKTTDLDPAVVIAYRNMLSREKDHKTTSEANTAVRNSIKADRSLTARQKAALDDIVISDGIYIPKDVSVDYTNEETFIISQMSAGAQSRWERIEKTFGMDAEDYRKAWNIYQDDDLKAAEKRKKLSELGYNGAALYTALGKK